MKYLIDAQISFKLANHLKNKGYDVIHTNDLVNKDSSTDNEIREFALSQNRIIISKDSDFLDSYLINRIPEKLLLITTGNIKNSELFELFDSHFQKIDLFFENCSYIELDQDNIIIHE